MIVEYFNETTYAFVDITDEFKALELDLEINITEGHVAEYSGASFEIPGSVVTITNGMYIRFRDGSTQIFSGYVTSLVWDSKRNIYSFDIKNEIDALKSFRIEKALPTSGTIEDVLNDALTAIQSFPRYEHFDTYTLGVMPGTSNGWEQVGTVTTFITDNTRAEKGTISLYTNRTTEDFTTIVNRFDDVDEGVLIIEHRFWIPSGGSAESWGFEIGNGNIGSQEVAAYYTVDSSDILQHHTAGGYGPVTGNPTINRDSWNTIRVELDIENETMNTWLNDVQVDTDYAFGSGLVSGFIDMFHITCQFAGVTGANNYWVDGYVVGRKTFLEEYTIVVMDSIAQGKLDLDDSDYSGLTSSLNYPGDIVTGTDTNDYYCSHEHQSEVYNQPITGAGNSWENYWLASSESGSGWQKDKNYGRATFNDLLHDMLLLMNGESLQHHIVCNVVNHEIRFYGHTEVATPTTLTASLVDEFEEDKTGEIYLKKYDDRAASSLRGKGTVSGRNLGNDYDYQIQKYEHKLRYGAILDLFDFRSHGSIRGIITALAIRKSMHEYILTEVEGIGVL